MEVVVVVVVVGRCEWKREPKKRRESELLRMEGEKKKKGGRPTDRPKERERGMKGGEGKLDESTNGKRGGKINGQRE